MPDPVRVSIIIPAYFSERTIRRCLESMQSQSPAAQEIIVVDSAPGEQLAAIVRNNFPQVIYVHSPVRLLPHAARNLGADRASTDMFVFTDPDIYAPPHWLANLLAGHARHGGMIVGSVVVHGASWFDAGLHFCKYDLFLPGGDPRPVEVCAAANMLCSRDDFRRAGGFRSDEMLGDTLLAWDFSSHAIPITFFPAAVVEHHHVQGWKGFLRERYERGADFGRLRVARSGWSKKRVLLHLLVTILPLRLAGLLLRGGIAARRAGMLRRYLWTLPVPLAGQSASLAGEAAAFMKVLGR